MGMSAGADLVYGIDIGEFDAPRELYEEHDVVGCGLADLAYAMGLDVDTARYGSHSLYQTMLCTRREYGFHHGPAEVDLSELTEGSYEGDNVKLKEACEALGIDFEDKEPGWYLCASYM